MERALCQELLVEQVLRLQVKKLAMIMSYTSSMNSAVVVFLAQLISDLCHDVCTCFTTVTVIPRKGQHLYSV